LKQQPIGGSLMANNTRSKNYNYTGKTIYVGMDVHKNTYSITAICEGIIVKRDTLTASPDLLIEYLHKRFGDGKIETAYEAGFCGFYLHRRLIEAGIHNKVIHAAGIEVSNDRVKTDKRDSIKIATHLSQGRLKCIYIPTKEREDFRAVTRVRDSFMKERTRIACQIKALLHQHGLIAAYDKKKVSEKWINGLSKLNLTPGIRFSLQMHITMWKEFNEKIKEIKDEMKRQAIKDSEVDNVYQSSPGIGGVSARILANELGNLTQFENERQIFSYVGLTPSEYSSGEHVRQGHITKQGKPILRKLLIQVAWTAIRHNKELREIFERIAFKSGVKRAIVAIARRIIGRIRACFLKKELYQSPTQEQKNRISGKLPMNQKGLIKKIA